MEISSDRGSTPRRSTKTEQVNLCICYYRIQEYVLFGVSKKIKVTTLYVTKVIYSVVIFMLYCGYEFNKSVVVERFPELSLFFKAYSPLDSEMICIFPYFCPYAESAREIREIFS